jgi:hypothetical protein
MRIKIILLNVLLLIFLFVLIYLYIYVNYNNVTEKFIGEGKLFNSISSISDNNILDVANNTVNANVINTESIEIGEEIPIDETYIGMDPKNAFVNVIDIMCQNKVVKLKGGNTSGIYFPNGYYWINIPLIGSKLLYLITNDEIHSGGWILSMRGTKASPTYNIINYIKMSNWTSKSSTIRALSANILSLELDPNKKYNPELGLLKYNNDLVEIFNISSIGKKIYESNIKYDCKYEVFNNYNIKEIMVIYYKDFIEDSRNKLIGYLKIPYKELDSVSTLSNLFTKSYNENNEINSFRTDKNMDLIYNFVINVFDTKGSKTPMISFFCLIGIIGTEDAIIDNGVNIPKNRYIYGTGITDVNNNIPYSSVLIKIPDNAKNKDDITYTPLGFELYVK